MVAADGLDGGLDGGGGKRVEQRQRSRLAGCWWVGVGVRGGRGSSRVVRVRLAWSGASVFVVGQVKTARESRLCPPPTRSLPARCSLTEGECRHASSECASRGRVRRFS